MEFLKDNVIKTFRDNTIGIDCVINTPCGEKPLLYADWAASGRLYRSIEERICNEFGPLYGNTHSNDSYIGKHINSAYEYAKESLLRECGAYGKYEIIIGGAGATFALHRFQEIMSINQRDKVIVYISGFEHNTNYLTWIALGAKVVIIETNKDGVMDLDVLENSLVDNKSFDLIIGSFIAYSNVTGIGTNYVDAVKTVKRHGGIGIVDYSVAAPHVPIDLSNGVVDVAYWGVHKLLGGPGGPGILLFKPSIYQRKIPSIPAGGTVFWTDPKQRAVYIDRIDVREDPGTPSILQAIKAAFAHQLINEISPKLMHSRETYFVKYLIKELASNPLIHVFSENNMDRMPIVSFTIIGMEYPTIVKSLSDFYGIQSRGGCSCAGTYAHDLLEINSQLSDKLYYQMKTGNYGIKLGWVRISLHAVMKKEEIEYISCAINEIAYNRGFYLAQDVG